MATHAAALLAAIGNTPLVTLDAGEARIFAKLESVNPGGSIKDRPVAAMLTRAMAEGRFEGGRRLLDSSSGNAGISYAQLGAALGIPVTIVVPGNASAERLERIRAHGAELIVTDPIEGYDFALREAHRLAEAYPQRYWHCDQYANPDNWRAHYEGTGAEILSQLGGEPPDCLVAGVGTGGTLTGVGRRLREANPRLHIVAAIPETFPGIEGLKPLGHPGDIVPATGSGGLVRRPIVGCLRPRGPEGGGNRPLPAHRHRAVRYRRALCLRRALAPILRPASGGSRLRQAVRSALRRGRHPRRVRHLLRGAACGRRHPLHRSHMPRPVRGLILGTVGLPPARRRRHQRRGPADWIPADLHRHPVQI